MLPVLQAEESMQRMMEHAMGAGTLKREDARRVYAEWEREAGTVRPKPKQTERQFKATLAAMGIGFEEVKAEPT